MKSEKNYSLNWQHILVGLLVLLSIVFVVILFLPQAKAETLWNKFTGSKFYILQYLGIGMGGILVALQALASHRRAVAMEETANAQAKANENVEKGQRQERLKSAIEHLGHISSSVRLGGAYELFHLASDQLKSDNNNLCQTILNILCAHIRQITSKDEYRKIHGSKPSEEIQSLLTLLFVEKHEIFKELRANLQGSYLIRANLQEARLENAYLEGALLQQANLHQAKLQGSVLMNTNLRGAVIARADLSGALIINSNLQQTTLFNSVLRGTTIIGAKMQLADLSGVQFQGALIEDAQMQSTQLTGAQLQGIKPKGIQGEFEGSISTKFADVIKASIGKESDLSAVIFQGGFSKNDLDALITGLSEEDAAIIRNKLVPHINKPKSQNLPVNSGAVTGSYSKEEAEEWIAEYPLVEK